MRKYTIVPLPAGPFERLDPLARMCFGFIWDRYKLSNYNVTGAADDSPWYDATVEAVYCVYSQHELAADIGCSLRTVRRCLDDLVNENVLWYRRCEYQGAARFYVSEHVCEYMRPTSSVLQIAK